MKPGGAGRSLRTASLGLLAAQAVSNLAAVVYHRVLSQRLGPAYASLFALIAVVSVLSNVVLGLNTALVKAFSADLELAGPGAVKGRIRRLLKPGLLSLGAVTALLLALAAPLAAYLKLPGMAPALTVAVLFSAGVTLLTVRSAQQGLHHFGWLSFSVGSEGLVRAGACFGAVGVEGGLLAILAGQGAGFLFAVAGLFGLGPEPPVAPVLDGDGALGRGIAEGASDTVALTLLALLCYMDVLVLKHHYSDARAGLYSRAALLAKSFLYLPAALNMVLLAAAARAKAGGRDPRGLLKRFLLGALALDAFGLIVVWIWTPFCMGLLAGPSAAFRTQAMLNLTRWFSLAVVPLGLLQMVTAYLLAVRARGVVQGLAVLSLVYLGALRFVWDSELKVVAALGIVSLAGLVLGLTLALLPAPPRAAAA
ncbi:MAG: hypothetical protein ACREKE_08075 [bacterium]